MKDNVCEIFALCPSYMADGDYCLGDLQIYHDSLCDVLVHSCDVVVVAVVVVVPAVVVL